MFRVNSRSGGLAVLFACLLSTFPAMAQVAGSVDAGLQDLASQIVRKSTDAARTKIAILPFPNADKSCSVLSTYIVDELTLALFSVPSSPLTIVERSQLEALINELSIGEGGLLNPETTKELGKISGVQALVVGTITIIGDSLRVNSRLVATETGQTISAAAVSIPKTAAVSDLLGQRVACSTVAAAPSGAGGAGGKGAPGAVGSVVPVPVPVGGHTQTTGDLTITVQSVSRSEDKTAVNLVLALTNVGKEPLKVMFMGPKALLLDDQGNEAYARAVSGMGVCEDAREWMDGVGMCASNRRDKLTTLYPQSQVTVALRFVTGGGVRDERETDRMTLKGDMASFSSRLYLEKGDKQKYEAVTVSMPNIQLR